MSAQQESSENSDSETESKEYILTISTVSDQIKREVTIDVFGALEENNQSGVPEGENVSGNIYHEEAYGEDREQGVEAAQGLLGEPDLEEHQENAIANVLSDSDDDTGYILELERGDDEGTEIHFRTGAKFTGEYTPDSAGNTNQSHSTILLESEN